MQALELEMESNLTADTGLSFVAHAAAAGLLYLLLFHHSQTILANLDLSLPTLQVAQARPAQPAEEWIIPNKKNPHPVKKVEPPKAAPEQASPWVPASQTARRPQWVGNLIDPDSYPAVARSLGGTGKVVMVVHIDSQGKVRDVRLSQGSSYEVLDQFAVDKVRNGIFTPAYDAQGSPVACEVILPIVFQLAG
jgi:TonB family protein